MIFTVVKTSMTVDASVLPENTALWNTCYLPDERRTKPFRTTVLILND